MRRTLAALAMLLTACGGGDPKTPESTAPPATTLAATPTSAASADAVRNALEQTRAKGTGTYVLTSTTVMGAGSITLTREGKYDARKGVADVVQTMRSEPAKLLGTFVGEPDIDAAELDMHGIRANGALYVQFPNKSDLWVRFTSEANAVEQGFEIEAEPFPRVLAMLEKATPSFAPPMGPIHYVDVPAPVAMRAIPGATSIATLENAGVDIDAIAGTVQVGVTVEGGVVTKVSFDAIEAFDAAWKKAGMGAIAGTVRSVETAITLSAHGGTVAIAAPTGRVITEDELKAAQ